jgi:hypothetical protein
MGPRRHSVLQHGFRRGRSTVSALDILLNKVSEAFAAEIRIPRHETDPSPGISLPGGVTAPRGYCAMIDFTDAFARVTWVAVAHAGRPTAGRTGRSPCMGGSVTAGAEQ